MSNIHVKLLSIVFHHLLIQILFVTKVFVFHALIQLNYVQIQLSVVVVHAVIVIAVQHSIKLEKHAALIDNVLIPMIFVLIENVHDVYHFIHHVQTILYQHLAV
jgi:hypothetical protein